MLIVARVFLFGLGLLFTSSVWANSPCPKKNVQQISLEAGRVVIQSERQLEIVFDSIHTNAECSYRVLAYPQTESQADLYCEQILGTDTTHFKSYRPADEAAITDLVRRAKVYDSYDALTSAVKSIQYPKVNALVLRRLYCEPVIERALKEEPKDSDQEESQKEKDDQNLDEQNTDDQNDL